VRACCACFPPLLSRNKSKHKTKQKKHITKQKRNAKQNKKKTQSKTNKKHKTKDVLDELVDDFLLQVHGEVVRLVQAHPAEEVGLVVEPQIIVVLQDLLLQVVGNPEPVHLVRYSVLRGEKISFKIVFFWLSGQEFPCWR
jgi:hypothetical protein